VRRTLRSVNIAEEVLAAAVARTAVVLAVAADSIVAREAEGDSTVAADTSEARVFGACDQPRHGKRVVARPGTLVDGALAQAAIPLTSQGARLARMARGVAMPWPDEGWVALM